MKMPKGPKGPSMSAITQPGCVSACTDVLMERKACWQAAGVWKNGKSQEEDLFPQCYVC